ncbi:hypothetical protein SAMN04244573_04581 [Azotobacter beijerinckii]|uniref:Uncharacterized protein n=1 Tax=Azotobacter beijerinckii TaxID=170623 RepID=A0A1H9T4B0_9GAMM|nr:hypothetical protein [Azotobacter beijerinckii]SER91998.1 hypothetical protein SAMN04244573_04581 [Azotobacter beijerinckii]
MDFSQALMRLLAAKTEDLSQVAKFFQGLDHQRQMQMCRVLNWGFPLNASQQAKIKVVGGYTGQPKGYNGEPTLLLAELGSSGNAKADQWILRIPLLCCDEKNLPLTVTLPGRLVGIGVVETEIARGEDDNFRPLDLEDFLKRPSHYTKLS